MCRDHREDGEGEGDVGRRRDGPAPEHVTFAAGQQRRTHEEQRGHRDTAHRGRDRQRRLAAVGQVAGHELALELDPRDEEEERQQAVGGPRPEAEVEVEGLRADDVVTQGDVGVLPGRVRPDESDHGGAEEQRAADSLGPERRRDVARLRPRPAFQQVVDRSVLLPLG